MNIWFHFLFHEAFFNMAFLLKQEGKLFIFFELDLKPYTYVFYILHSAALKY